MADYAFGDSTIAAARLALLARTYAASSEVFLRDSVDFRPRLAADLGCGPGYSTHLLASVLGPIRTIGLDNSEIFLAEARATATESVSFDHCDLAAGPFPHSPFDLMYGRFLLTHLRDPGSMIQLWIKQLRPLGALLMEEVESIESPIPEFIAYLDLQQSVLSEQGNALYVGPQLGAIPSFNGVRQRANKVAFLDVPATRAASMFHMNLATIREREFVRDNYDASRIDELYRGLLAIADCKSQGSVYPAVRWVLRQISLERSP
ncbi:MAG: class I SAM-dependent methyltransferase [Chloroflexota bacterium]|nr:class I SAM-dependent methyltransferase [Chloroflexota bacterium]